MVSPSSSILHHKTAATYICLQRAGLIRFETANQLIDLIVIDNLNIFHTKLAVNFYMFVNNELNNSNSCILMIALYKSEIASIRLPLDYLPVLEMLIGFV